MIPLQDGKFMQERAKLQYTYWGKIAANDSEVTVNGWLSVLTDILMCREGVVGQ